jgi:hypothetical protein
MNKSESIKELAGALAKAQGSIKGAIKDSANPFFKSKYADLSSVVEAIREAFAANNLSYVQRVEPSEKDEVRVETVILHASGEWLSCGFLALPVSKHDAQGFGSAMTYARRYSLSAACGVAPEDDDGNAATKAAPKPVSAKSVTQAEWETLTPDQQTWLMDIANGVKAEIAANGGEAGYKLLEEQGLDNDMKTALWSRFDSKERSAIKAASTKKVA